MAEGRMREVEATVWCPSCREVKFTVYRVPVGDGGVFTNEAEPRDAVAVRCQCGAVLERKRE